MAIKTTDVLKKKQEELNTYVGQANAAIALVTDTVETLANINSSIDTRIQEIEDYQAGLDATKSGLTSAKARNERIIKNFRALLD